MHKINTSIFDSLDNLVAHKIIKQDYLDDLISQNKDITNALGCTNEKPLVFTNGVFDVLHKGHLTYLAQAKSLGYKLIIGLNSDLSTKMLNKGDDRPINKEHERTIMLAGLVMVDYVAVFEEKTPIE